MRSLPIVVTLSGLLLLVPFQAPAEPLAGQLGGWFTTQAVKNVLKLSARASYRKAQHGTETGTSEQRKQALEKMRQTRAGYKKLTGTEMGIGYFLDRAEKKAQQRIDETFDREAGLAGGE